MLRTKFNKNTLKKDIIFQIVDWKSNDIYVTEDSEDSEDSEDGDSTEEKKKKPKTRKLIIRGYGVTED